MADKTIINTDDAGKAGFTKGPWSDVKGTTTGRGVVALREPKVRFNVAACGGPNREANARLIAAAPELYDELARIAETAAALGLESMAATANAALAKARGAA